jgi:hypothetical protein
MTDRIHKVLESWHQIMTSGASEGLRELLSPDCTFWSPVVHTPQQGRDITVLYLGAASQVFGTDFRYNSPSSDFAAAFSIIGIDRGDPYQWR